MSHDDIFNSRYGPRIARGGIKSQNERGKFGKTWWARRWINVIEELDLGGRLGRGRVYARRGQVLSIDIQEGSISARVQGSRLQPYTVHIGVNTIPVDKWVLLSETAFNQAIVAAKLLAAEMPEDIEKLFAEHGVSLFPASMNDFATDCSCPDYSNPCKHIASVYYLLSEEFDRDPFLIFRMRGLSKEKLIDLITTSSPSIRKAEEPTVSKSKGGAGRRKSSKEEGESSSVENKTTGTASKRKTERPTLPLGDFWKVHNVSHLVGAVHRPAANAALPKRLGHISFWRSSYPFLTTLEEVYKIGSENAIRDLADERFSSTD